jgi:hypothetical protein
VATLAEAEAEAEQEIVSDTISDGCSAPVRDEGEGLSPPASKRRKVMAVVRFEYGWVSWYPSGAGSQ